MFLNNMTIIIFYLHDNPIIEQKAEVVASSIGDKIVAFLKSGNRQSRSDHAVTSSMPDKHGGIFLLRRDTKHIMRLARQNGTKTTVPRMRL